MYDDIAGIDQHPVPVPHAFRHHAWLAGLMQGRDHPFRERDHLARGTSGCDHHVIGDGGLAEQIDNDEVFGLAILEGALDPVEQALGGKRLAAGLGRGARDGVTSRLLS